MNTLIERLKRSWLSLTMWFNASLATVWLFLPELTATLPAVREYLDGDVYKKLMLLAIIGNMILRVKTTQDLANKGK
jgi:hypothetical protein